MPLGEGVKVLLKDIEKEKDITNMYYTYRGNVVGLYSYSMICGAVRLCAFVA